MKKIIYAVASLIMIATFTSCEKNNEHVSKQIVIDTTLASGTPYVLSLSTYGDADDIASISKQGAYYTTSEIINTPGTFAPVYNYTGTSKTSVTDQVVLSITEGSHGNGRRQHNSDSTTITINFTIK